jgi:hypothetical protein
MWERRNRDADQKKFSGAAVVVFAWLACAAPAFAQTPHVRGEHGVQRLVDEAARRSPMVHALIERLQQEDVTVYVRTRVFPQLDLEGRVALLSTVDSHRYLVIELACGRSELAQMATLGHELFHALEIAATPAVVSAETLADFYSRIGTKITDSGGLRTFETEGAAAAGVLARQQLLLNTTRHGHGT